MERFVNEREAAHITGYSRFWFQQKRCRGGGPPYMKINGHTVRYALSDLLDWMNSHGVRHNTSQQRAEPRDRKTGTTRILRRMVNGRERLQLVEC